jgi:hypothetical protein
MPIFLLLNQVTSKLRGAVRSLNAWERLVEIEGTLVSRARGAFIVRWFGPGVPISGSHLKIAIVNLDALAERYRQVQREAQQARRGPNLLDPMAGLAGTLMGTLLSPFNSMVLMATVAERVPRWYTGLGAMFNTLLVGTLGLVAGVIVGLALGAGGALAGPWLVNQSSTVHIYNLLGALAEMAGPMDSFWDQLSGPRGGIRNVVLGAVLGFLDKVAQLVPFVLALAAIVFSRTTGLISRLADQLPHMAGLGRAVMALFLAGWESIQTAFARLGTGPDSLWFRPLMGFLRYLNEALPLLGKRVSKTFRDVEGYFLEVKDAFTSFASRQLDSLTAELESTLNLPFLSVVVNAGAAFDRLKRAIFEALDMDPDEPGIASEIAEFVLGPAPSFPGLPSAEEIERSLSRPIFPEDPFTLLFDGIRQDTRLGTHHLRDLIGRNAPGNPLGLSPEGLAAFDRMSRPFSVFGADLARLRRQAQLTPAEATAIRQQRDLLFEAASRVLPPSVAQFVPQLESLLQTLDRNLHRPPVRDLPSSDRLQPVVVRLRVRGRDANEVQVRQWVEQYLRPALQAQSYLAPAES